MCYLKNIVFVIVTYNLILIYGRPDISQEFRSDYTKIGGRYYKFHEDEKNWTDSIRTCESEGATLYFPEDANEASEVNRELHIWDKTDRLLIGISDLRELHSYESIDGRPISNLFHIWHTNEPSSGPHDMYRCVVYRTDSKPRMEAMNVHQCENSWNFVCKFTPLISTTTEAPYTEISNKYGVRNQYDILCDGDECAVSTTDGKIEPTTEQTNNNDLEKISIEYSSGSGVIAKVQIPVKMSSHTVKLTSESNSSTVNITLVTVPKY